MFDKVASNFVDLDNPAEVEQLRRFYGGETVGKSDGQPRLTATEKADRLLQEAGARADLPPGKQMLIATIQSHIEAVSRLESEASNPAAGTTFYRNEQKQQERLDRNRRRLQDAIDSVEAFDQMSKALESGDPALVPSSIGDHAAIPDRVKDWIKKQPAFDLRDFESSKDNTIVGSPITELLLRGKGETLSNVNGSPQKIARVNPPSNKFPLGSITLAAQDPGGKRRQVDLREIHDMLRYSAERLNSGDFPGWMENSVYDFSESSLSDLDLRF
jgi:hypothetical protein